jgi:hypothetical protein
MPVVIIVSRRTSGSQVGRTTGVGATSAKACFLLDISRVSAHREAATTRRAARTTAYQLRSRSPAEGLAATLAERRDKCILEIITENLSEAGWSWGCVSAIDSNGRTIFVADAHRDDGKRFVVHADEKLTAFLELERITLSRCNVS